MENVICFKWGDRYDPSYVNILAASVRRNMTRPYRFVCFTEKPEGIDPSVEIRPLPEMTLDAKLPERGWRKLTVFQSRLADLKGRALYLDLDIVIMDSLDPFFEVPGEFRIIRDWNLAGSWIGNSSVFRFEIGKHPDILDHYLHHGEEVRRNHRNEQAYLSRAMKDKGLLDYWDPQWCLSFKKHCLRPFPTGCFLEPKKPGPATKIVVFHGQPNPHQVLNGWRNWKKLRVVRPAQWINDRWRVDSPSE